MLSDSKVRVAVKLSQSKLRAYGWDASISPLILNVGTMQRWVEVKHSFLDHSTFGLEIQGIVIRFPTGKDLAYFNFQLSEVPALLWYELLRWKQHRYFVGVLYGVRYAAEETVEHQASTW